MTIFNCSVKMMRAFRCLEFLVPDTGQAHLLIERAFQDAKQRQMAEKDEDVTLLKVPLATRWFFRYFC